MNLRLVAIKSQCIPDTCPTIYETDRDTYIVQGIKVLEECGVNPPDHEALVEIPAQLLLDVAKQLGTV